MIADDIDSKNSVVSKAIGKKRPALSTYNLPNKVALTFERKSLLVSKIFTESPPEKKNKENESVSFHESSFYTSFESSYLSDTDSTEKLSIESQSNHLIYSSNLWCHQQINNSQETLINNINMRRVVNNIGLLNRDQPKSETPSSNVNMC